MVDYLEIWFW